jgi:hypothetical protein
MFKNTAGKWVVFAWTTADGLPKTGDALNITANIRIDGGIANAIDDTNPAELEDGYYIFDITSDEANGDNLVLCPQSGTSGVQVIGVPGAVWTRQVTSAQTGDGFARLGAPTGASIAADIATLSGVVSQGVPHYYYPATIVRTVGTDQGGTVANLAAHDEVMHSTGEVVGTGLDVLATISTSILSNESSVFIPGYYNGSGTHNVGVYAWNYTLSVWEQQLTMLSRTSAFDYSFGLTSDHQDPVTGEMKFRFLHSTSTYIASHRLHLDMIRVTKIEATAESALGANVAEILAAINILIGPMEGALTIKEMLRILLAATAGKVSGGGTGTVNFRDLADGKNRITATVAAGGNRTAITLDGTD